MEKIDEEQIKETNQKISEALKRCSNIMLMADADEWSYFLDYSDEDVLNALYIFNHIAGSVAIKKLHYINEVDAIVKLNIFKDCIYDVYDIDAELLIDKVYGKRDLREKPS